MWKFFKDYLYTMLIILSCWLSVYLLLHLELDENTKLTIARFFLNAVVTIFIFFIFAGAIIIPVSIIFMIYLSVSMRPYLKKYDKYEYESKNIMTARRLLANGVPDEIVIQKTGLSQKKLDSLWKSPAKK